ncbi:MAG TPA: hypothetical protein VFV61_09580, partial [Pyrinomonadaceae bacterium]|nr:hypothetical protein [Pyrinomonadaceae bacterium]
MATRILCLLTLCASALCHAHAQTNQHNSEYLGRYTDGAEYVVYFEQTPYGLTLRPALWTATQLLKQTGEDQFTVTDRASRGATFHRDQRGAVVGVSIRGMEGEGLTLTRASRQLPIEMLLAGDGQNAARAYLTQGGNDAASRILKAAERVLARFPTKASNVVAFLSTATQSFAKDANLHTLLAYAQVASGDRKSALASFRRAYTLDPTNRNAVSGLALLQALPAPDAAKDTPWKLPFPLAAVFAPPTAGEIRAVEADWQSRDLSVRGVEEVTTGRIKFEADEFTVRIVSHQVHGQRHYGAIISPVNAKP